MSERMDGAGWGWGRVGGVLGIGTGSREGEETGQHVKLKKNVN